MYGRTKAEIIDAMTKWLNGASDIVGQSLGLEVGRKYARIYTTSLYDATQRTVFAFIDQTNGDILSPNGWKGPTKRKLASVFDADNGLGYLKARIAIGLD